MKAALALAAVALLPAGGTIRTVAGTGKQADSGDGGPATKASIDHPRAIAFLRDGSTVFSEPFANRVRRIARDGTISTVAGTGDAGGGGDGGRATKARLNFPHGVAAMPDGGFVVADMLNSEIRRIWSDGHITTVAGTGRGGYSGDGGQATAAELNLPRGVTALPDGELLIADSKNNRVRRVWLDGRITTVAGTGPRGDTGDGGPARKATLDRPFSIAPLANGGFLVAEAHGNRVRRVGADGRISTVAGTGVKGYGGDGGPAKRARLNEPHSVAALADGGFLVADEGNHRVRRVWPDGTITTVVGTGRAGFSGDGGAPAKAQLNEPKAIAILPGGGGFLLADAQNQRIRLVTMHVRAPLVLCPLPAVLAEPAARAPRLACALAETTSLTLTALRRGHAVARARAHALPGTTALVFPHALPRGTYVLRLSGRTADGRRAAISGTLRLR